MRLFLLLDTYSLFFRAYHALPDMRTTRGEPTSGMYGFVALLFKLLREQRPEGLAFALDLPEQTHRRRRYAEYKAGRDAVPDLLLAQLSRLHEFLSILEVPVFFAPGYEADDVLATLAKALRDRNDAALVVSGDRDLLQVAHGTVKVLFVGARGKEATTYGQDEVKARFGVLPGQLPSWVALVGDPSDNLPKVPGIGPQTATRLVLEFGDMTTLFRRLAEVSPAKLRDDLERHRDQVLLNEELAKLEVDVPLDKRAEARPIPPHAFDAVRKLLVELEFQSLVPRFEAIARTPSAPG
jgi:DNA polymerase-1